MNKKLLVTLAGIFGAFLLVLVFFAAYIIGALNEENSMRRTLEAHQANLEVTYDNTWKIIKEQATVSDQYKDAFKDIYVQMIKGRYEDSQNLIFKFVNEANPSFDSSLMHKLMSSIQVQRTIFTNEEKKAIEVKREHDTLLTTIPRSFVYKLFGRESFDLKLVTSTRTKQAFENRGDDELLVNPK